MQRPDYDRLHSALFYAWKKGLKTGMYYLRSAPAKDAQQFTLDGDFVKKMECRLREKDCEVCGA
ncbi:MAG: hypothetical protein ACYCOU_10265 [Sulfobacillus sp.]